MAFDPQLLQDCIEQAQQRSIDETLKQKIIAVIDLTSLNDDDTAQGIADLCQHAKSLSTHVAAVCVYPQFVKVARQQLKKIKIATVANFPDGQQELADTIAQIESAIDDQANEIDIVMPYQTFIAGDHLAASEYIQHCKRACGDALTLKIILESGAFENLEQLHLACKMVTASGADFIKTSTGKHVWGASPETACVMLLSIKESGEQCGFKASGGIREVADAAFYYHLAAVIMGDDWVKPDNFRIGASQLLEKLIL